MATIRRAMQTAQIFLVLAGIGAARADVSISSFLPSVPSPQQIGSKVVFTAIANGAESFNLRYRFRVRPAGGEYATVIDYGVANTFTWVPLESEGAYDIEVSVSSRTTGSTAAMEAHYMVTPRATTEPVAASTSHPMVALYSAPPCAAGSTLKVFFKRAFDGVWRSTNAKPCNGTTTMNFLIGGMLMNSTYILRGQVTTGEHAAALRDVEFSVAATKPPVPPVRALLSLDPLTTYAEGVTLIGTLAGRPFAVDGEGEVVWYFPGDLPKTMYTTRILEGGTQTAIYYDNISDFTSSGFREYDLLGNTVKQTTTERINDQLSALGKRIINTMHHDVRRLPDGKYLTLGQVEVLTDAQGPGADVLGDVILVLDSNLQVVWTWDTFDHLDVTRLAVLGETCTTGPAGCVVLKAPVANDWTHGNALALLQDGNLLYNSRHQDLSYKISYANGTGDGSIIWKLGKDGDFTWQSNDPYPWFSHAHDVDFQGSANIVSLFDNGNTRVSQYGGNSRGQVLQIDEANRTVTPLMNTDLGVFSAAIGSAEILSNGHAIFDAGLVPPVQAQIIETDATGKVVSILQSDIYVYRAFRVPDLYTAQ